MTSGNLQAGPGTIAEAMIRGLPIILNGYIAGQVIPCAIHRRVCMSIFLLRTLDFGL
jgi:hypothetical protein